MESAWMGVINPGCVTSLVDGLFIPQDVLHCLSQYTFDYGFNDLISRTWAAQTWVHGLCRGSGQLRWCS